MSLRRRLSFAAFALLPLVLLFGAWVLLLFVQQGGMVPFRVPHDLERVVSADGEVVAQGRRLAQIGNCAGCHTAHAGAVYAGGRAFVTPYGTIYSSNLTSDPQHGIGSWSLAEFRHAMRHGVSRNGVQSPVFPYANFARLRDDELDALFAFLASVPAVASTPPPDRLEFPANLPGAMTAWRLLYYRPAAPLAVASSPLQRGAAIVEGIGHCAVCHGTRGNLSSLAAGHGLGGGRVLGWYAPALDARSLAHYAPGAVADYLRGGSAGDRGAYGKMADVIAQNLQFLSADDAVAVEQYLRSLTAPLPRRATPRRELPAEQRARGDQLYRQHCADCHGRDGRGEPGKYPALTDSSAITGPDPINAIKLVLFGAVAPATPQNPQPYTMPPFAQTLSADDVAALVSTVRARWGDPPRPVDAGDIGAWGGID